MLIGQVYGLFVGHLGILLTAVLDNHCVASINDCTVSLLGFFFLIRWYVYISQLRFLIVNGFFFLSVLIMVTGNYDTEEASRLLDHIC